jgi:MFS superfamily sulfate permease-like transporter
MFFATSTFVFYAPRLLRSVRQLIVGPDAATCAMITVTLTSLVSAEADPRQYHALAVSLTLFTGFVLAGAAAGVLGNAASCRGGAGFHKFQQRNNDRAQFCRKKWL